MLNKHSYQVLAEAENELNEISFGNDEAFKESIKEVDEKLETLLKDIKTGIDGGDKTLFELINSVFEEVIEVERLAALIDVEDGGASKNVETGFKKVDETQEIIRQIQDEMSKLLNATTVDGPGASQDAFDRSEKFDSNSSRLKEIYEEVKLILKDYEENLINAKALTMLAIEKFTNVSLLADTTITQHKEVSHKLTETDDIKLPADELESLKKLVKDALEKTEQVYNAAFDFLNEVTEFELTEKLNDINEKIEKFNEHSDVTTLSLNEFSETNLNFLDEMEGTIDAAEIAQTKAFKLQNEIEELLKTIKNIHKDATNAIAEKDSIINHARKILSQLEDFNMKIEMSKERARSAMEIVPKMIKKIEDGVKIIVKLEDKLDDNTKKAFEAKEKCLTAKTQMDEILQESEEMKVNIANLKEDIVGLPLESTETEATRISDEFVKLEKSEDEDSKLIESAKIKIELTKSQASKTDVKVDEALEKTQDLINKITQIKNIDQETLDDFGK